MKFLYEVAGFTRTDHQRSTEIRKESKVSSLNIKTQNYGDSWLYN
jgi:hypothetical protein